MVTPRQLRKKENVRYTNNHNLPQPIVDAIINDDYDSVGDISVSKLIASPRRVQLEKRHDDSIVVDVADHIFMLLGTAVHSVLEKTASHNSLVEERMLVPVNGWMLSGKPDLLDNQKVLSDYKTTTVYGISKTDKVDWVQQLNSYRFLYENYGFEVHRAQVVAIIKDFSKGRAASDPNYPPAAAVTMPIPLWPIQDTKRFVEERVRMHQEASLLPDDELPECTDTERWCNNDWIITKPGASRATRKFSTKEEAEGVFYAEYNGGGYELQCRQGNSVRCQSYCNAAPFCNQWRLIKGRRK